jgi:hypothetical protein
MKHISHDELNKRIRQASQEVEIGKIYKHYKYPERDYQVLGFGIQEASQKVCVRYKNIKEANAPEFIRDLDSWLETVEWNGQTIKRFTLIP